MQTFKTALLSGCLVCFLTGGAASAGATAAARPKPIDDWHWTSFRVSGRPLTPASAPADEYFGRFKLSNLGVRNIIHDISIEGNSPLAIPKQVSRIQAADWAMVDWANKYPRDRWLPGAMLGFAKLLQSKGQPAMDVTAIALLYYLADRFGRADRYGSEAGRLVRGYDPTPNFSMAESAWLISSPSVTGDAYFARPH